MKKEVLRKEEVRERLFGWSAVILFGVFLVIGIVFYVSLSVVKSGDNLGKTSGGVTLSPDEENDFGFGLKEIMFAVVFALFMVGFLLWTRSLIMKNSYLGACVGIIGGIMMGYGFYLRYKGPYSTGFMIATAFVIFAYVGMNFFRYRKENYEEDEE